MSPAVVVVACMVVVASCGASQGVTQRGLPELLALDAVLWDLREALDARGSLDMLPSLSQAPPGLHNETMGRDGGSDAPHGRKSPVPAAPYAEDAPQDVDAAPNGTHYHAHRASGRIKRSSPTPPPFRPIPPHHHCPPFLPPPAHLGQLEQILYQLQQQQQQGCHPHGCPDHGHHCPVSAGARPCGGRHTPSLQGGCYGVSRCVVSFSPAWAATRGCWCCVCWCSSVPGVVRAGLLTCWRGGPLLTRS